MSSIIPQAVFIQQSDEGTEVFFLEQVGVYAGPTKTEEEWHVMKQNHIPRDHPLNFILTVRTYLPAASAVEFDPQAVWFVRHEEDQS